MKNKTIIQLLCILVCLTFSTFAGAQEEVPLELENVSGNVYCLYGPGGNIGILKADDGILVIDSQFPQASDKILKKIASLSAGPVKYLINTHYHDDHTSGNEVVGKNAEIIMHPNCKKTLCRILKEQKAEKSYISGIKTWEEGMVLKLGDETVRLLHFGPGHTAGDMVVVFEKAKVIHAGDLFFNGLPPYIDVQDGSDTGNWVRTIETLCKDYPGYKVIPGHGKVTDTKEYQKFAEYLTYLRKETAAAIKAGKTKAQAMESINTEKYKDLKEHGKFLTIKNNIGWIYDEMSRTGQ